MKIVKVLSAALFAGALAIWIFAMIWSPIMQIQTLTPERSFGDTLTLTTTVWNVAPFQKSVPISNTTAVPVLLVDGEQPPDTDHTQLTGNINFAPLSTKKITANLILAQASTSQTNPQILGTDATTLTVTPGTHTIQVTWGQHISQPIRFTVN